jgi:hypothetical protein
MLAEANPSKVWVVRLSLWVALGGVVVTAAVVFGIWAVNTAPGNAVACHCAKLCLARELGSR